VLFAKHTIQLFIKLVDYLKGPKTTIRNKPMRIFINRTLATKEAYKGICFVILTST